ncbi:MAG: hypothetical protein ACRED8_11950 [Caulobacteraceae bacterium]
MTPKTAPPLPLAIRLRREIEKAETEGLTRPQMTLRLTLGDAILLKRDPSLALADIGFVDGAMRFLGVKVVEGGVSASELVASA